MKQKLIVAALMSIGLATLASNANATITWDYASKISMTGSAVDNGNGTWNYTFNVLNTDPAAIWYINIYTGAQQAYNLGQTLGLTNTYTQFTGGGNWGVPAQADQWFAGFYNNAWPGVANFASGASGTLSFTTNAYVGNNLNYAYWTQNNYGNEHFTGFGTANVNAVPEPETYAMLLAGLGLMGAVARRRKLAAQ